MIDAGAQMLLTEPQLASRGWEGTPAPPPQTSKRDKWEAATTADQSKGVYPQAGEQTESVN